VAVGSTPSTSVLRTRSSVGAPQSGHHDRPQAPQERSLALKRLEPIQLWQLDIMVLVMITRSVRQPQAGPSTQAKVLLALNVKPKQGAVMRRRHLEYLCRPPKAQRVNVRPA
jgi:hypothetical protein